MVDSKLYRHVPSKRVCSIITVLGQTHLQFRDTGQCYPLTHNGLYSFKTIEALAYEN